MKICKKHNEEHVKKGSRTGCRSCNREYQRSWLSKNRETQRKRVNDNNKKLKKRNAEYICNFLSANPCVVCSESDIVVLDFDHIDPKTKYKTISEMIRTASSLEKIIEEIAKCQVLCANCHRRKTAESSGWQKLNWR